MEAWKKELYMYVLGALIVSGAFGLIALMIFKEVPIGSKDTINIAIGIVLGLAVAVVNYFYGSSKSSADKDKRLNAIADEKANDTRN